jgi:hypothetical protein
MRNMANHPKATIPPEAAAIMAAMVKMPPKPHEEMKLGKPRATKRKKANPFDNRGKSA